MSSTSSRRAPVPRRAVQGAVALTAAAALAGLGWYSGQKASRPSGARRPSAAPVRGASPLPAPAPVPPLQAYVPMTPQEAEAINAATPVSTEPSAPAAPFKLAFAEPIDLDRALTCLTQAVYYEAGTEPEAGRRAVAQVVINRLRNAIFPKTVCGVVFQGSDLPTGCQFTFTCDGSLARNPEPKAWAGARRVAKAALDGATEPSIGYATHYHAIYVVPAWKSDFVKVARIGLQVFYRWPGGAGAPAAFRAAYFGGEPREPGAPDALADVETASPLASEIVPTAPVDLAPGASSQPAASSPLPQVELPTSGATSTGQAVAGGSASPPAPAREAASPWFGSAQPRAKPRLPIGSGGPPGA